MSTDDLANEVDRLRAEVAHLRQLNESLINRLAAACEVLGRKANQLPAICPHCGGELTFPQDNQPIRESV